VQIIVVVWRAKVDYRGGSVIIGVTRCVGQAERRLNVVATLAPVVASKAVAKEVVTIKGDRQATVAPAVAGTGAQNAIAPGDIATEDASNQA
jgi:hypothetical protein